jgi:hypothetical protein
MGTGEYARLAIQLTEAVLQQKICQILEPSRAHSSGLTPYAHGITRGAVKQVGRYWIKPKAKEA